MMAYWRFHAPRHPEAAGGMERWDGHLMTQVLCHSLQGGTASLGWARFSKWLWRLYICTHYMVVFPQGQESPGIEGEKRESAPQYHPPVTH